MRSVFKELVTSKKKKTVIRAQNHTFQNIYNITPTKISKNRLLLSSSFSFAWRHPFPSVHRRRELRGFRGTAHAVLARRPERRRSGGNGKGAALGRLHGRLVLVLVWFGFGFGLVLVFVWFLFGFGLVWFWFWFWFGFGFCLVFVWFWFGLVLVLVLVLVWFWFGLVLVWFWFGLVLVLVLVWFWFLFGFCLVLVWFWFGFVGLVWKDKAEET